MRFVNEKTHVVVNVDEATAAKLGSDWKPVAPKPSKPAKTVKRNPRRKSA